MYPTTKTGGWEGAGHCCTAGAWDPNPVLPCYVSALLLDPHCYYSSLYFLMLAPWWDSRELKFNGNLLGQQRKKGNSRPFLLCHSILPRYLTVFLPLFQFHLEWINNYYMLLLSFWLFFFSSLFLSFFLSLSSWRVLSSSDMRSR